MSGVGTPPRIYAANLLFTPRVEERRPDYLVLMKTNPGDELVWQTKGLDGGALAVLARAPCRGAALGGERPHPDHSNVHCTACRHLDMLTMGSPLG